ncbi:TetR/AcrR family transcriptional regulator [Corallococcus exiguus]|uniref:TetR/AcrR family transcriptional regulator n=2 Tax=Myxococcaceae TaxID=31 RepID=UPI000EED5E04|nr:TetR/AcrR family transcriptional regulator [Corallococcus exiguus]NNB99927.1 TetR/AcrR family transcriptional regulator [Corallococcus exiguus]NNC08848.1 TetR/AcrR family transcriptional regulator [Corallococcus exiguus]NPC50121.1 TetR/AcrR family transcriptional regulator [Corallococcus exiguus]RKH75928.1 TetR/AcrR family transcriptional regulator [Corallococcus sp. AB032C]
MRNHVPFVKAMKKTPRADAQRNLDSLLEASKAVFAESGVDAPVREIASRAGVGIATVYRHFPQRADLIAAVYRREIDACAAEAPALAREHEAFEALTRWLHRFTSLIATKRGLAASLNAQDPAYQALPAYFREHLEPVLQSLLGAAAAAGQVRKDVNAYELLRGVANLCVPVAEVGPGFTRRMVDLLIDGLRYGASAPVP